MFNKSNSSFFQFQDNTPLYLKLSFLFESINNLKLLANFDYLGSLIKECKNLDESVYTPATFEKLKEKLF